MYRRMARGRNPAAGGIAREENEGSRSTLGPSEYRGGMRIGQSEGEIGAMGGSVSFSRTEERQTDDHCRRPAGG